MNVSQQCVDDLEVVLSRHEKNHGIVTLEVIVESDCARSCSGSCEGDCARSCSGSCEGGCQGGCYSTCSGSGSR